MEGGLDSSKTARRIETADGKRVFLFRYDNPQVPNRNPNSQTSQDELVGKWFTDSPVSLASYIKDRPPGGNIIIVEVPKEKLEELRAINHPVAKDMDIEPDNFIIPDELLSAAKRIPLEVNSKGSKNFRVNDWKTIDEAVGRIVKQVKY